MIAIGGLTISGRVLAAPFSGISNLPFRVLARRHGAAVVFTEMIKARPWVDATGRRTDTMIAFAETERPVFAQVATGDPDEAARVTELAFAHGFDGIDLNMGCPVKKVSKSKCGAYLIAHPELAGSIVAAMERRAEGLRTSQRPFPVTVKTRIGMSSGSIHGVDFGRRLEAAGAAAITMHARTKDMGHSGAPRTDVVAELKSAVRVPVFFNGGVNSPAIAARIADETGCDGVMIGRASFGNPWIFSRVERMLATREFDRTAPTLGELRDTMGWHFSALRELFGDFLACRLMRRYGCWYIKGIYGSTVFRLEMGQLESPAQFAEVLEKVFGPYDPTTPAPLADWYDAPLLSPHMPDSSRLSAPATADSEDDVFALGAE